jgi:hypothetical protein
MNIARLTPENNGVLKIYVLMVSKFVVLVLPSSHAYAAFQTLLPFFKNSLEFAFCGFVQQHL